MSILQEIAQTKKEEVERLKRERGLLSLREGAKRQKVPKDFLGAIQRPGKLSLIAELKKASPSKGVLRPDFSLEPLAHSYARAGAQALSVLTDAPYFQGHLSYLKLAQGGFGPAGFAKGFHHRRTPGLRGPGGGGGRDPPDCRLIGEAPGFRALQQLAWELSMTVLVEVHDEV
jgi:indole-3-glycerol phosphate synthase